MWPVLRRRVRLPDQRDARTVTLSLYEQAIRSGYDPPVRLWDGTELGPSDRGYRLVLRHPWSLRALLLPPTDLTAGEAYVGDAIDVSGSMLAALHELADHREALEDLPRHLIAEVLRLPTAPAQPAPRRAQLRGRTHSRERDRQAVRFHYDVGNRFYRTFLDRRLVYSCAYFTEEDDDLDRAQLRKLDLICRKLHLRPGERLLDIGCGWGALVTHAARVYGVHALGITLSREQATLAAERVRREDLDDRIEIRVADYRELEGTFDAVASVGMVEHVGAGQLATYFHTCAALTAAGGRFLNHGITTGRRGIVRDLARDRTSFVARHVFPDGALMPAHTAVRHAQEAGFDLHDVEQLRPHYARTLTHWVRRLEANADEARHASDDTTYRVWRAYMAGSAVAFARRRLGVIQVLGSRGARLPLTRTRMLPSVPTADPLGSGSG